MMPISASSLTLSTSSLSFSSRSTPPADARVDEGHPAAAGADPRRLVDERHAPGLHLGQGRLDVVHQHADVVQAGALLEEPRDHRRRVGGLQQLQVRLAHGQEGGPHLLGRHLVGGLDPEAQGLVGRHRLGQVGTAMPRWSIFRTFMTSPILPGPRRRR